MAGAESADPTESDASPVDRGRRKPAGGGVAGRKFFTTAGPRSGPILWREDGAAIDVLRHADDLAPIGPAGRTDSGIALWEIIIEPTAVPGLWIVLGREFLPRR
jgi:hypothetical protein